MNARSRPRRARPPAPIPPAPREPTIAEIVAKAARGLDQLRPSELASFQRYRQLRADLEAKLQELLGERHALTRAELCELLGVVERTLYRQIRRGDFPKHRGDLKWNLSDIFAHFTGRIAELESSHSQSLEDQLKSVKLKLTELKLARERRDVVESDDVARAWSQHMTDARTLLLTLPERVAILCPSDARDDFRLATGRIVDDILKALQSGTEPVE